MFFKDNLSHAWCGAFVDYIFKHDLGITWLDSCKNFGYVPEIVNWAKNKEYWDIDYKNAQNFWDAQVIFNVLEDLTKAGTQEDIRAEMENDVLEYIGRVKRNGGDFNDPFLESYIYSVISKLSPDILIDGITSPPIVIPDIIIITTPAAKIKINIINNIFLMAILLLS